MTEVSIVGPRDGEIVLSGPIHMRILEDGRNTSHRLGLGEITIAAHTDGPPQHRHAQHDEGFYVLSGNARFTVGPNTYDAGPGTLVMIPPGVPHTFANPGDEPAVLLNTFTPDLYVQYFRDLRDMVPAGQPLTADAITGAMSRYATVPATDFAAEPTSAQQNAATMTYTVDVAGIGPVPVTVTDRGHGHPILLLHGGAGPRSVNGFADMFAGAEPVRVITPVHPGFDGTERPDRLAGPGDLAQLYLGLIEVLDLSGVTVVGNSVGGWVAAEMALGNTGRLARVVLVDAVGIDVPEHPVVDFFSLTPEQISEFSYHDPEAFRFDPATLPAEQRAALPGNRAALAVYGGATMTDPTLMSRLAGVDLPTLVLWGDSDRIASAEYGRAFADAIPGARFQLLTAVGHVPQVESPEQLLRAIWSFARDSGKA